jgi:hypothetical protein
VKNILRYIGRGSPAFCMQGCLETNTRLALADDMQCIRVPSSNMSKEDPVSFKYISLCRMLIAKLLLKAISKKWIGDPQMLHPPN